jgi:hypothetical protein
MLLAERHAIDPLVDDLPTIRFGGREAHLTATTVQGDRLRVEVKASGVSSWQELKQRDLDADRPTATASRTQSRPP